MEIMEIVKKERKLRRITQMELAEISGIAQSHISRLESGEYEVTLKTAYKLLNALGLTLRIAPIDPNELDKSEAWKSLLESQE